jgi:hypothetical protein
MGALSISDFFYVFLYSPDGNGERSAIRPHPIPEVL